MKRAHEEAKSNKVRIHIIITLIVMLIIFVHSAMPGDVSGSESSFFAELLSAITGLSFQTAQFVVRKAAHFTVFTILGICLTVNFNDYKAQDELVRKDMTQAKAVIWDHPLLAAWITGTLYAATDEFHQLFVEGRSCEFRDACIDAAGVAFGIAIAVMFKKVKSKYNGE